MTDLKDAADATSKFRLNQIRQPTQIRTSDLPLFVVLDEADANELQDINPEESIYDGRYEFGVVMMFKDDCPVTELLSTKDLFLTTLYSRMKTSDYQPFRWEDDRQYPGHWGGVQGRFVRLTFSRYILQDFSS